MQNTIAGILGFSALASIMLSGLVDMILSATWARIYFTSGMLVFERSISVGARYSNIPCPALLNKRLYSFWMGGFVFKQLDNNKYGFRRKFFSFAPNPIMHGLVVFDDANNQIIVKGYLDWFMVSFSIMWLILVPLMWLINGVTLDIELLTLALGYVAFYALIAGILYFMDYSRLAKIARTVSELWSRKYVRE